MSQLHLHQKTVDQLTQKLVCVPMWPFHEHEEDEVLVLLERTSAMLVMLLTFKHIVHGRSPRDNL